MCAEMRVYYHRFDASDDDEEELLPGNGGRNKIMVIKSISARDDKEEQRGMSSHHQRSRRASATTPDGEDSAKSVNSFREIVHLSLLRHENPTNNGIRTRLLPAEATVNSGCDRLIDTGLASMIDAGNSARAHRQLRERDSGADVVVAAGVTGRQHADRYHHQHERDIHSLRHQLLKRPLFAMDPVDQRLWDPCPCRDGMKARLAKILNESTEELYPIFIPEFMGPGGRDDAPAATVTSNEEDVVASST